MRPSLQELCQRADVHAPRPVGPPWPDAYVDLARGLLEMRRAGLFSAVWCDENRFHIALPGEDIRHMVGANWVARVVDKFRELQRKGVQLEFRNREEKTAW